MKKKICFILCFMVLLIGITGCKNENSDDSKNKKEENVVLAVDTLIKKANAKDLDYEQATTEQKRELWTFEQDRTEKTQKATEYRYIGTVPSNYVTFNDELWRIIGIFSVDDGTGKVENRIKLMRDEAEKEVAWHEELGNDWTKASLNTYLNNTYYNELTKDAQGLIDNAVWYLGGIEEQFASSSVATADVYYQKERGSLKYQENTNETSITAKVGLLYASDYGYSTSGSKTMTRENCLKTPLLGYDWTGYEDCHRQSWIFNMVEMWEWTMNPISTYSNEVVSIDNNGRVTQLISTYSWYGQYHPVVYLKSNVVIASGEGTKDAPYVLK